MKTETIHFTRVNFLIKVFVTSPTGKVFPCFRNAVRCLDLLIFII